MNASVDLRFARLRLVALLALPALLPAALDAQEAQSDSTARRAWLAEGVGVGRLLYGHLRYDPVASLPRLEGRGTFMFGASLFFGPPFPDHLVGFDIDAWNVSRSYASTIEGAADSRTDLSTWAFGFGTRIGLPMSSPVGLYALGGFHYVAHTVKVDMDPAWFVPYLPNSREEESSGWRPYWGFVADVRYRDFAIALEHRTISSNATFDENFGITDAPLGGSALLLGVSWYAGRSGCGGFNPFDPCDSGRGDGP